MARRVKVDEDALEAAYTKGDGLAQLQRDFGINRMTARKILLERGVVIRSPGRPRKMTIAVGGTATGRTSAVTPVESTPKSPFAMIDNSERKV